MNLDWVQHPALLVINLLAAFRLTRLVVEDAFPFGVLRGRLRDWANDRWKPGRWARGQVLDHSDLTDTERRQLVAYDHTAPLAYLATCYACMSVWISGAVAVLASTGPWWTWVAAPLAFSTVAAFLAAAFARLDVE